MKLAPRKARPGAKRIRRAFARLMLVPLLAAVGSAFAAVVPDKLSLLVPDRPNLDAWQVKVWVDTAAEQGIPLQVITRSQLLQAGSNAPKEYPGLVVPDSAYIDMDSATVAAVKQYATLGGNLMLVYDAGVRDERGLFPINKTSPFSDLVGVNYVYYQPQTDPGLTMLVGFGPVVGTKARLESLNVPPGKYVSWAELAARTPPNALAGYVPTSRADPGGTLAMASTVRLSGKKMDNGSANVRAVRPFAVREILGLDVVPTGPVTFAKAKDNATKALEKLMQDKTVRADDWVDATIKDDLRGSDEKKVVPFSDPDTTLQAISAYAYGPLNYFSFVTTGDFLGGVVYLSSKAHGLVAGARKVGSGQVLFVNMPLGYLKAIGTDGLPLHGFMALFAREHLGMPMLSQVPQGRGGLVYNWHVDDGTDLNVDVPVLFKARQRPFEVGPFSIHFTAGPGSVTANDGNGMDLPNNRRSQERLRELAKLKIGHEIGSHGGWIHDDYGYNANELNRAQYQPYLEKNFAAIENVTGRKIREYSAPLGNNPKWAVEWLEQRGVVAYYDVGQGATSATRPWRDGKRLTTKLWSIPVVPFGPQATFEEFEEVGISDRVSGQWLLDLQSFAINQRTVRMFYSHPPGAAGHLGAIEPLLKRGNSLDKRFSWYTMVQVADFAQRRLDTEWKLVSRTAAGFVTFEAKNANGLTDLTWLLPKSSYFKPVVVSGAAKVDVDSRHWTVTAEKGTVLQFGATER